MEPSKKKKTQHQKKHEELFKEESKNPCKTNQKIGNTTRKYAMPDPSKK